MRRPGWGGAWAVWVLPGAFSVGCRTSDQDARCLAERQAARQDALSDEFASAERRLRWVREACGPNSMSDADRVQRLIRSRRDTLRRRREAEARKEAALRQATVGAFVSWATEGAYEGSSVVEASCAERGTAAYGFCSGHNASSPRMRLRYWKADPRSVRYTLETDEAVVCEDLGPHRSVRRWQRGPGLYERCELTSRELRQFESLIVRHDTSSTRTTVHIYSNEYVSRDSSFARELQPDLKRLDGIVAPP